MSLKKSILKYAVLSAGTLLCSAPFAVGQTVTFTMVGTANAGAQVLGDVADPYEVSINGAPFVLSSCDDFADTININESWTANLTNLSAFSFTNTSNVDTVQYFTPNPPSPPPNDPTNATPAQQTTDYIEAAVLSIDILNAYTANNTANEDAATQALWTLTDPSLATQATVASTAYSTSALAEAQLFTNGTDFETANGVNVQIYTYNPNFPVTDQFVDNGVPVRPQEFISVTSVDEPPSPAVLGSYLLLTAGVVLFFRRRASRSV